MKIYISGSSEKIDTLIYTIEYLSKMFDIKFEKNEWIRSNDIPDLYDKLTKIEESDEVIICTNGLDMFDIGPDYERAYAYKIGKKVHIY